ncbi:MAG TPA: ATP synthase subunit I [Burkholderiales bacterium]|nr:ATP synthase subunit I [Burkholderiales bacterium]
MRRILGKPVLTVLKWQIAATALLAVVAALIAGAHGAGSAAAGGSVSIVAGMASALVAVLGKGNSAGGILVGALRAEAVKIGLALLLLWLVLSNYPQAAVGVLLGTFVVTMLIFSMAFFVREY